MVFPYGLTGACWGLVAAAALGLALSQWHLKELRVTNKRLVRACTPSIFLAVLCAGPLALVAINHPPAESNFLRWAVAGGVYASSAWLTGLWLSKHPLWSEITKFTSQSWLRLGLAR